MTPKLKKMLRDLKNLTVYDIVQLNAGSTTRPGDVIVQLITTLDNDLRTGGLVHGLTHEELSTGRTQKIHAIKMVRARTGIGLAEAKKLVEEALDQAALSELPAVL